MTWNQVLEAMTVRRQEVERIEKQMEQKRRTPYIDQKLY